MARPPAAERGETLTAERENVYIVWKSGDKEPDGRRYSGEQWFTQKGRLFRVHVHTDPSYRFQSHRRLDMMSEAGWTCIHYSPLSEDFNRPELTAAQWAILVGEAVDQAWIVASALEAHP